MPTFESIPLHPVLKQRLLEPPNPDGVSISTPQALLSRTPRALAEQLFVTTTGKRSKNGNIRSGSQHNQAIMKQIDTLRSQVAHAMMAQTSMGKYRLQQQQLYDDSTVDLKSAEKKNDHYFISRPLILGATVNAMQAWQQEQERKGPIASLSTGCRVLDELLCLPPEYSDPRKHRPNHHGAMGLPRGHVLCFTGHSGSGKSQWCLQLAAQALRQPWIHQNSTSRVRYCYSSAGHDSSALAHRLSQLLQYQVSPISSSSTSMLSRALQKIEFQPIRTTTQLVATLKTLEEEFVETSYYIGTPRGSRERHAQIHHQPPFVLIVDSLSNLEVLGDPSQASRLYRNLKRLSRQYSLWVVLTVSEKSQRGSATMPLPNVPGDYRVSCQSMSTDSAPSSLEAPVPTTTTVQATMCKHPTHLSQPSITLFHTPSGMSTRASPTL